MLAAKEAGMRCIAIPDPSVADEPLIERADVVVAELADIDEDLWARVLGP